ncbi:MAG TPA: zinc-binding dehydrogenase [Vicinamibacterales bacterium]|nr:zinc-binding dehydrogenase [Vicinamibacterales bacterium]
MDARILAAVMPAPRKPVEIREFLRPDIPPQGALLRTARAEVCGTDVHLWHGRLAGVPYPIIPGHVSGGTLEAAAERLDATRAHTHGEGFDVVIEAAGSARAVEEGLDLVRDGGRYVIAGHYTDVGPSTINAHRQINRKHLEIRGCWGSEPGHFLRALAILERHAAHVPWRDIGERVYPLTGLNEALADAEAMRITKAVVDPWAAPQPPASSPQPRRSES